MFGKVKLFFGIEGVKIDLEIPPSFNIPDGIITGALRIHTKHSQTVKSIQLRLVETYQRGRGKSVRTDEYIWGQASFFQSIAIPENGEKSIDFKLPFEPHLSEIDKLGSKSKLHQKFTQFAKFIKSAKSKFHIEVTAEVAGTALNPVIKKEIELNS